MNMDLDEDMILALIIGPSMWLCQNVWLQNWMILKDQNGFIPVILHRFRIPVVPRKAVAEVSKIGDL